MRLNYFFEIIKGSIKSQGYFQKYKKFVGYVVLIEEQVLLKDLLFYQKIFRILKKEGDFLVIKIDFENQIEKDSNALLINYFKANSVTSIYYHDQTENSLVYDFFNTSEMSFKEIYKDLYKKIK